MSVSNDYNKLVENLKTERDELNVRMHLAGAELRDDWQKLEERWEHLNSKLHQLGEASSESSGDINAAIKLLGEELKAGYKRVRSAMH